MLLSMGGNDGGIAFYVQEGKLVFVHNYLSLEYYYVRSGSRVPPGTIC